jgi:5-methylthioadenosine/S-adenosylhomocysteine deaminase
MGEATTIIKGGWIVAWQDDRHRILQNGVVVFRGSDIIHVGREWPGEPDRTIDAGGELVCPGFISTHCHAVSHAGDRLVIDGGRRDLLRTGFLNYVPRVAGGPGFSALDNPEASHRFGFATLLKGGVTTFVQLDGGPLDDGATILKIAGESGMRLYYSPVFSGGDYSFDAHGRLLNSRDDAPGLAGLKTAEKFIERHNGSFGGKLRGMLVLDELFNASPALLTQTKATARALGARITVHAAEQLFEFHDILRRTGMTPVGWMEAEGFLGEDVIVGHCVYISGHSYTGYPYAGDLDALKGSGCHIAHAPVALSRRGVALESFQRYLDHGIKLSIGTDSYPLDMIGEMRAASIIGKIVDANNEAAQARDVFNAATIGGADALGRSDLGRIAKGAKADFIIIDMDALDIGPVKDPIRALIHSGSRDLIDRVIVDGQILVEGGKLTMWNERDILEQARAGAERVWANFDKYHWSGKPVEEVFPESFDRWKD